MKKLIAVLIVICAVFSTCLSLTACSDKGTEYKLVKIIYDIESDSPVEYFIDNEQTQELFGDIIKSRGNLIILKNDTMIFNGEDTKDRNGKFEIHAEDSTFVDFDDGYLMVGIFCGTNLYENEIHAGVRYDDADGNRIFLYLVYAKH